MRRRFIKLALVGMFALLIAAVPQGGRADGHEGNKRGLFINLTTDNTRSAAKAISFAHFQSQQNGHDTAIWLNVRAIWLADRKRLSHIHAQRGIEATTIQDMLSAFIADGGTVIMCGRCSKLAGLKESDLIDGVTMGSWPVVEGWLFRDGMQTLGW